MTDTLTLNQIFSDYRILMQIFSRYPRISSEYSLHVGNALQNMLKSFCFIVFICFIEEI